MTYNAYESSVQDGDPVLRFVFASGDNTYAYTTENTIVADSNYTFTPAQIKMGEVSQTNEMAKDPLTLEFPRDHAFASLFLGGVPEQITTVTVFRGHAGDTSEEFQFYWKGRIAGASASGQVVRIDCENVFTSLRRAGLRARYQKKCRHALYQTGCGVDKDLYASLVTVSSASGFTITINELDSNTIDSNIGDADEFVGGMIETNDGHTRYIISQSGNVLTLIRPLQSLIDDVNDSVGGAEVTLYPGCAHTRAACKDKFDNLLNFGGFPWIPSKNPFGNNVTGSIA